MSAFKNLFGGGGETPHEELVESGDHDEAEDDGKGFMTESVQNVSLR